MNLMIAILLSFFSTAQAEDTQILCFDSFQNGIVVIDAESPASSCRADVVWGFDNVCYIGYPEQLMFDINGGLYKWGQYLEMADASIAQDGETVNYTGYDRQSFWSGQKDITPCTEEFFEQGPMLD
jgi:hypothetical protein